MMDDKEKKGETEGQHWTQPGYVDPRIRDRPPVGVLIGPDAICRNCMTVSEEITMRRGFIDPLPAEEAAEKGYACSRCGKRISAG